MERSILIVIIYLVANNAFGQSRVGITGQRDTSFTTYSAWVSAKKKYPDIKIVPEFHSPAVIEKKGLIYCGPEDRKLLLDVFYPKKKNKKRTAIVIIHGGGWRSGDRSQHYPLAQRLAGLGYVCITPQYNLSTEELYPEAVFNIKAALRWLKLHAKEYDVDTGKITVLGFSAGGELAAFMGVTNGNSSFEGTTCNLKYSSDVHAVVDIDGTLSFVHPESGEGDDSKKTSAATYWFGYAKKEKLELWEQASPLTWAGKNSVPTLFINSSVDRMHAGREDYIKILTENNIYTEMKGFPDSPHPFCLFEPWFDPTVKYIDEFLKKIFNK